MTVSNYPHPLDYKWRKFGSYFKLWYDVKHPITGEVQQHCWPNAGQIHAFDQDWKQGDVDVRLSETHPMSGAPQFTKYTLDFMERFYG